MKTKFISLADQQEAAPQAAAPVAASVAES
jgi:hypothetical protein